MIVVKAAKKLVRKTGLVQLSYPHSNRPQGLEHEKVWTEGFVNKLWDNAIQPHYIENYVAPLNKGINRYLSNCRTVLDVGCGWMPYTPDERYTGLDVSEAMIQKAKELHPHTKFILSSAYELPANDNSFEGVRSSGMLRHMKDWRTPLKEILRVASKRVAFTHMIGGEEKVCGRYQWCTTLGEVSKLLPQEPLVWVVKSWKGYESVLFMLEVK